MRAPTPRHPSSQTSQGPPRQQSRLRGISLLHSRRGKGRVGGRGHSGGGRPGYRSTRAEPRCRLLRGTERTCDKTRQSPQFLTRGTLQCHQDRHAHTGAQERRKQRKIPCRSAGPEVASRGLTRVPRKPRPRAAQPPSWPHVPFFC